MPATLNAAPSYPQVTAVDRSAGTIMCTTQLLEAASKQWGAELTAVRLLPLLSPLLVSPALSDFHTSSGLD